MTSLQKCLFAVAVCYRENDIQGSSYPEVLTVSLSIPFSVSFTEKSQELVEISCLGESSQPSFRELCVYVKYDSFI